MVFFTEESNHPDSPLNTNKQPAKKLFLPKRTLARLVAIQAIYSYLMQGKEIESTEMLLLDVLQHFYDDNDKQEFLEKELILTLVKGTIQHHPAIDKLLSIHLSKHENTEKLSILMRALLWVGIFELQGIEKVPSKVIINEYVTIARQFYSPSEIGFVNAILDKLARKIRTEEFPEST